MLRIILLLVSVVLLNNLFAQSEDTPIEFDGQIRVRSEADGRDFNNDSDINTFTLMRTRFGAQVQPIADVNMYVQIQDSRAFGEEPNTLSNTSNLDIHQAYFQVNNLWDQSIHLKVGRQELLYANQRIIGPVGFSNVGRSFDGLKLTFGQTSKLDLFGTIIDESNAPVSGPATPSSVQGQDNHDNTFWGAYYMYRANPNLSFDVYGLYESNLNQTVPGESDLNRATIGSYFKHNFTANLNFESEGALQFGERQGQDVIAFMITGFVNYTFPGARKPSLGVGYDFLSGMDENDEDYGVFDTLFATNHKFYGFMDYFINIPVNTNSRGLQNFMIKARVPFANKFKFNVQFHNFRAAKGEERNFGNELDLVLNYKYNAVASFELALALFLPDDLMEQEFQSDDLGIWTYLTLLANFPTPR